MFEMLFSVVPHITDAVQEWVTRVAQIPVDGDEKVPDVCIIEVCKPQSCCSIPQLNTLGYTQHICNCILSLTNAFLRVRGSRV